MLGAHGIVVCFSCPLRILIVPLEQWALGIWDSGVVYLFSQSNGHCTVHVELWPLERTAGLGGKA